MSSQYYICPNCGAHLDSQDEVCDCQLENAEKHQRAELEKKSDALREQIIAGIHKDAEIRRLSAELEAAHVELRKNWTPTAYTAWNEWHRINALEKQRLKERAEKAEAEIRLMRGE